MKSLGNPGPVPVVIVVVSGVVVGVEDDDPQATETVHNSSKKCPGVFRLVNVRPKELSVEGYVVMIEDLNHGRGGIA